MLRGSFNIANAHVPNFAFEQGSSIGLTVGAMGIQLFRHKKIITS